MWSEETFGDPQNFRPERFLDENGHLKSSEHVVYFGMGKRR